MRKIGVIFILGLLALGLQSCGGAEKCPAYGSIENTEATARV